MLIKTPSEIQVFRLLHEREIGIFGKSKAEINFPKGGEGGTVFVISFTRSAMRAWLVGEPSVT